MVTIARPPLGAHHSNESMGRKRYKRDDSEERHRDDFGDQYAYHGEYRKTSANMFGNSIVSGPRRHLMPKSLIDTVGFVSMVNVHDIV